MSGAAKTTGEDRPSPGATAGRLPVPHESGPALGRQPADAPEPGSDALRALARETGAVIVLKGSVTRISDGDRVYHSFFGGPVLARGGSGDLLAGLTAGCSRRRLATRCLPRAAAWCGTGWPPTSSRATAARSRCRLRSCSIISRRATRFRPLTRIPDRFSFYRRKRRERSSFQEAWKLWRRSATGG